MPHFAAARSRTRWTASVILALLLLWIMPFLPGFAYVAIFAAETQAWEESIRSYEAFRALLPAHPSGPDAIHRTFLDAGTGQVSLSYSTPVNPGELFRGGGAGTTDPIPQYHLNPRTGVPDFVTFGPGGLWLPESAGGILRRRRFEELNRGYLDLLEQVRAEVKSKGAVVFPQRLSQLPDDANAA